MSKYLDREVQLKNYRAYSNYRIGLDKTEICFPPRNLRVILKRVQKYYIIVKNGQFV